jgi:hypothetical protein
MIICSSRWGFQIYLYYYHRNNRHRRRHHHICCFGSNCFCFQTVCWIFLCHWVLSHGGFIIASKLLLWRSGIWHNESIDAMRNFGLFWFSFVVAVELMFMVILKWHYVLNKLGRIKMVFKELYFAVKYIYAVSSGQTMETARFFNAGACSHEYTASYSGIYLSL